MDMKKAKAEVDAIVAESVATLNKLKANEVQSHKENIIAAKMAKLDTWRMVWGCFMLFIVFPAWICAAVVEGESLSDSAQLVARMLSDLLYAPHFIAALLCWPVAIVAKLIPASSTWPFMTMLVLGAGFILIPLIVFAIFFGHRLPPYFWKKKFEIDPDWLEKANVGVIKHAAIRSGPFSSLIVFLVISGLIGVAFILPGIRLVVADRWEGKVYLVEKNGKEHPLDATVSLNFIDPGYIVDVKPGVHQESLAFDFSGNDLKTLKELGISEKFLHGQSSDAYYSSNICEIRQASAQSNTQSYYSSGSTLIKNYHFQMNTDYDKDYCPKLIHLGIESFDNAELAINLKNDKYFLAAHLVRDSRWSFIERQIMRYKFNKNPTKELENRALGAPLGYR